MITVAACSRDLSRGNITIVVVDATSGAPTYANRVSSTPAAQAAVTGAVYLLHNRVPLAELGHVRNDWRRVTLDRAARALFDRTEGVFTAVVDINGDGRTDAFARDITTGTTRTIVVSGTNPRDDGAFLAAATDRDSYVHGDTVRIRVRGWLPATEPVHAEIWNAWNGGFQFWTSAPMIVGGEVDFTVSTVIPDDWPQTSTATGSDYFAHPATAADLFAGTRFELVGEGSTSGGGPAPTGASVLVAGGAEFTTEPIVPVAVSASGAAFYRLANVESNIDTRPWATLPNGATTVTWLLASGPDGTRTVFAQFAGTLGVPSAVVSDDIILDTTPPAVTDLAVTPAVGRVATVLSITFALSEPVQTLTVTLGGNDIGSPVCTAELVCRIDYTVVGNEGEGVKQVVVRATDAAGLIGEGAVEVVLDFTAPETFLLTPLPSNPTTQTVAEFSLASNDAAAVFACRLDGGAWVACAAMPQFSGLGDGSHTFEARAVDVAGNADPTPVSHTWVVDTTPPITTLLSYPPSPTSALIHRFTFTANEPASFRCMLVGLGLGFDTCVTPKQYGGLPEGLYTFHIFAVDLAGNVEPVSTSVDWVVDFTPVTAHSLSVTPPYAALGATVTIQFDVGEPLANDPLVWVGAEPATIATLIGSTYTYIYTVTGGEAEVITPVIVHVRDDAFNLTVLEDELIFDFTAPDTVLEAPLPDAYTNVTSPSFGFAANEDIQGFDCLLEPLDLGFVPCAAPHPVSGLADGAYVFRVRAVDLAGNADTTPAALPFTVDTVPPAPPVAALLQIIGRPTGTPDELEGFPGAMDVPDAAAVRVYANTEATFFVAATDALAVDGSFAAFPFGDNTGDSGQQIYVVAVDLAGNKSTPTPLTNFSAPPFISPFLLTYILLEPMGLPTSNGIGNPGDTLYLAWNNTPSGNAQPGVVAVWAEIPGLNTGPVPMTRQPDGTWDHSFVLAEGPYDSVFAARVSAVNSIGLESGWQSTVGGQAVDVELPPPPTNVQLSFGLDPDVGVGRLHLLWVPPVGVPDLLRFVPLFGLAGEPVELPMELKPDLFNPFQAVAFDIRVCEWYNAGVRTEDDANNLSTLPVSGPVKVEVFPPDFLAWGGVQQLFSQTGSKAQRDQGVENFVVHFAAVSEVTDAADPRTWLGSSLDATFVSPLSVTQETISVGPLYQGTRYAVAASAYADSGASGERCYSEFAVTEVVETLGFVGVGGSQVGGGVCVGDCAAVGTGGEQFFGGLGFSVVAVSDVVSGDGVPDLVVGVPGETRTVVMSGDSLTQVTARGNYFISQDVIGGGPSLARLGDIDGDGVVDVAVGSPLETTNGVNLAGVVRVYSGAGTQSIRILTGFNQGDQAGYAVAGIGDVSGDAVPDILVGAFGCVTFDCSLSGSPGHAYVFSGADGALLRTHVGPVAGGFFGITVTGGIDFNSDGIGDYAVGAPGHLGTGQPMGAVYLFDGASGGLLSSRQALDVIVEKPEQFRFGAAVSMLRDTAAGDPYLVVGAPHRNGVRGAVIVLAFTPTGVAQGAASLAVGGLGNEEFMGMALKAAGDIDGNGLNEFIVGSPNIPLSSGFGGGNAFLVEIRGVDPVSGVPDMHLRWQIRGGLFDGAIGYAFDHIRDVNGDGLDDLVIGAPGSFTDGLYGAGLIYIMSTRDP